MCVILLWTLHIVIKQQISITKSVFSRLSSLRTTFRHTSFRRRLVCDFIVSDELLLRVNVNETEYRMLRSLFIVI